MTMLSHGFRELKKAKGFLAVETPKATLSLSLHMGDLASLLAMPQIQIHIVSLSASHIKDGVGVYFTPCLMVGRLLILCLLGG